ncbi:MAG: tetratricopeptide repeat protein [Acidobacteriaceae bacterium]|nr:tetratricopeptide repeat protein [Acidobacteriaceae bacterium]
MATAAEAIAEGRKARSEGDFTVARERYAAAAQIYRARKDDLAYAHAIRHIADIYLQESKLAEAGPLYEESLELYRANLGTKILDLANALRPYALLNEGQGNPELARALWQEARHLYNSIRIEPGVSECDAHIRKLQQS